ncbi:MAG TPA: hypothetical protein VG476_06675 [Acidimicrobiales bacterium]|nr:hypothetical protein [Acidimicrobiales bacterium]
MMWKWRRRRESQRVRDHSLSRETRSGTRLAREIEAFLSGSSGEWFIARGREVPTWAYVNRVAHADPDVLWQLAAWQPGPRARLTTQPESQADRLGWRGAVALLAGEVLDLGGSDPCAIRQIQLDRLLPLESALMSRTAGPISPEQLVARGRACLRDHPSCEPPL